MIVKENIEINGMAFVKHYSDANLYIRKVGTTEEYTEAIDLPTKGYEYEETDKQIEILETPEDPEETEYSEEPEGPEV